MTEEDPKLLGEIAEECHVLGKLVSWEERVIRHPPQSSPSSLNEGISVGGQLWEHGERVIVEEPVTSALNACSWQSSRINEGMAPEQCHTVHCNSQQVEGSARWDRHSSGDLRNRQMDGQDEGSKRIHNQRDLTNREEGNSKDTRKLYWWSIRRGEEELILGWGSRTDFDPPPNYAVDDPVPQRSYPTVDEVLVKAQFLSPLLYQIHCIGLVGFKFAHIYSERHSPNRDLTIWFSIHKSIQYY